jgi:hypothetical protein
MVVVVVVSVKERIPKPREDDDDDDDERATQMPRLVLRFDHWHAQHRRRGKGSQVQQASDKNPSNRCVWVF